MKFKLDENFGTQTQRLFLEAGHEAHTVAEEDLSRAGDEHLYDICRTEERCLITLDLDFADVIRFPPARGPGLVVFRPHGPLNLMLLEALAAQFLEALQDETTSPEQGLWIVEMGRIRIYQPGSSAGA